MGTRLRRQGRLDTFPQGGDRRPWAIYGRISKVDREEGAGAHVKIDDQLAQSRALVLKMDPRAKVLEFRDNASAWNPDVVREGYGGEPGFNQMVALLEEGQLAGIVCWHTDRLTRQMVQQTTIWRAMKATRAQLHTVKTGHIQDATMWMMEGLMNERASDLTSERLQNHHELLARTGQPNGGLRQFGYTQDKTALVPEEAEAIQDAAARVLGGESLSSIARDWTRRGILPAGKSKTEGKPPRWSSSNIGKLLTRPSLAGWRTWGSDEKGRPAVYTDEEGRPVKGCWPAIITDEDHEALKRLLHNPARRTQMDTATKYLLSGVGSCATCGLPLKAKKANPGNWVGYTCKSDRHVHKKVDLVDSVVVEAVVARLSRPDFFPAFKDDTAQERVDALTVERANLESKRERLADEWADALTPEDENRVEANQRKVEAKLTQVNQELNRALEGAQRPDHVLKGMTGPLAREQWEAAPVTRQRAIVKLLCESVTLQGSRQKKWDPHLVQVVWK